MNLVAPGVTTSGLLRKYVCYLNPGASDRFLLWGRQAATKTLQNLKPLFSSQKYFFFEKYQYVAKNIGLIDSQGNFVSTPAACPLIFRPFVTFDREQIKWYFLQKLLAFMIITKVNKT